MSKLNCEVLLDELAFEVRWAVAGDSIVLQLVAKLEDGEYMSFGVSGSETASVMVGADVAVAWVDKATLKGYAVDYYLDAKSQCAGVRGSCPDERLGEKTNSIRLLNAALVNGYSIVTYQRPLRAADELDRPLRTNGSQPVVWALGPLNARQEVSYHHHFTKGDKLIEFGRPPVWNCPMPEGEDDHPSHSATTTTTTTQPPRTRKPQPEPTTQLALASQRAPPAPAPAPKAEPWDIPPIQCYEPPDGVFYAQMGPTGGKQGYPAITGHVGWGVSWYINGLLIPELWLVRGRRYTFVVEGGSDPDSPARYHPFYITNDPVGGYFHKSDDEKRGVEIFAGVRRTRSGEVVPTGVGRLCSWTADPSASADQFPSFGAYQRALTLVCEEGSPGVVTWTPDKNTPDTVYYQCFTHRHLGWKIHVVDECDAEPEAAESRVQPVAVAAPGRPPLEPELEPEQVASHPAPATDALDQRKLPKIINTKHNYNDFSSQKGGEIFRGGLEEPVVSMGQLYEVIEAVEGLERGLRAPRPPPEAEQRPREADELSASAPAPPQDHPHYFLPGDQPPLTLQSVLKPNAHAKPHPHMRPPFRRPSPPELNYRRPLPPQMHHNHPPGYPLPMPTHAQGPYSQHKKPYGKPYGRPSPMNRAPPHNSNANIPPMKAMPPLHHQKTAFHQGPKPLPKFPSGPVQSIIMGQPLANALPLPTQSQTLSVGHADLIANQIVKSQITLPGADSAAASSVQSFASQPGQIILGKPMDHPVPLDQQMAPTRQHLLTTTPPDPTTLHGERTQQHDGAKSQGDIKSSDFVGEHAEASSLPPAVNTGFKPNTIVIESGFKPIIREPLMDRIGDYGLTANRREDTDVVEDYEDSPQPIANQVHSLPSDKLTETFEPMFIPSPPDNMHPDDDVVLPFSDRTKEVFPSNHAKEDRPHPVYVNTESDLNALFSKTNMEKEVPSEMVMDSDRVSPQYLPPDPNKHKEHSQKQTVSDEQTFTTYDGKIVSAATLTSVPDPKVSHKIFSSKLPANTELLLKTPQFGPFRGVTPPLETSPVTQSHDKDEVERTTHLKLVNTFKVNDEAEDELNVEASEIHEVQSTTTTASDTTVGSGQEKDLKDEKDKEEDEAEGKSTVAEEEDEEYEEDLDLEEQQRHKRDTNDSLARMSDDDVSHDHHDHNDDHHGAHVHRVPNKSSTLHWPNFLLIMLCLKLV